MQQVMQVLVVDNENNASKCLLLVYTFHKAFKNLLQGYLPPLLEFFKSLYRNFPAFCNMVSGAGEAKIMRKSVNSFQLVAECPLLLIFLFQLYPAISQEHANEIAILAVGVLKGMPSPALASNRDLSLSFFTAQIRVFLMHCPFWVVS